MKRVIPVENKEYFNVCEFAGNFLKTSEQTPVNRKGFFSTLNNARIWVRGLDSNQRLSGYEPDELPLLYSAEYPKPCERRGTAELRKRKAATPFTL